MHERVGRPAPVAAVLLAPALALAGCTGEEPGPAVPTPTAGDGVGAVDAFREQLEALRDLGDAVDQHTAMEEDIAACMAALGFEYTPVDLAAQVDVVTAYDLGLDRGSREYAEQFGYGIATDDMGFYALTAARAEDPNAVYVASLTEAARAEYEAALWGDPGADPFDPDADRGCSGKAQDRVYLRVPATDAVDPEALFAEEALLREAILTDDRVVATHAEWAACMADAGYPGLADPGDNLVTGDAMLQVREEFDARLVALQAEIPPDVDDPSARAALAALQAKAELADREVAMAVADVDCRESSGYAAALAEVSVERQAEFFEAHRAEYEAYAAAMAELLAARD